MKDDPSIRRDKRCARKGCTHKIPELGLLRRDPFCSARCSKLYHGVEYKSDQESKKRPPLTPKQKRMIDNSSRSQGGARPKYA